MYWLLFSIFATGAMASRIRPGAPIPARLSLTFLLAAAIAAGMIGLRWEVGADWRSYEFMFAYARYHDLAGTLAVGDPGYQFLNWAVQKLGGEIWIVNLACGSIFTWGLFRLCRNQPSPWLAFLVAVPYLVIVVAMGYTRQAAAIGILMAGLASLERGTSTLRFALYVAVAALFHKTAVVVLPLVIFAGERNRLLNVIGGLAIFAVLFDVLLADSVDRFVENYVETAYQSQGAAIRVAMSLIPAILLLVRPGQLGFSPPVERIWRNFAFAALGLVVALIVVPSSTAVDRIALYVTPLQVVVLPRVFLLFRNWTVGKLAVVAYAFAVQFTWLNFADHARFWSPYYSIFDDESGQSLRQWGRGLR